MGGVFGPSNPFVPPQTNVTVAAGVLTSAGPTGPLSFVPNPPAGAGTYLSYVAAAGASNNVTPVGFGAGVGRLDVNTAAGAASFTGLIAGSDGQLVTLGCIGANSLTLLDFNAGSAAANQFRASAGGITLLQWDSILVCYYAGTVNKWVIV